jgi:hypothetical protein
MQAKEDRKKNVIIILLQLNFGTPLRATTPNATIVGFDSFEGLPETWRAGYEQGVFNLDRNMPDVFPPNVAIYRGWFDSTIPRFKKVLKDERIPTLPSSSAPSVPKFLAPGSMGLFHPPLLCFITDVIAHLVKASLPP